MAGHLPWERGGLPRQFGVAIELESGFLSDELNMSAVAMVMGSNQRAIAKRLSEKEGILLDGPNWYERHGKDGEPDSYGWKADVLERI